MHFQSANDISLGDTGAFLHASYLWPGHVQQQDEAAQFL
jgi:hypothetical protein